MQHSTGMRTTEPASMTPPPLAADPGLHNAPALIGDIGGTHARFAVLESGVISRVEVLASADYAGVVEAAAAYLERVGRPTVASAALAVATPVDGDTVAFTNLPWAFSIEQVRKALRVQHLRVVNDFAALARAVPLLHAGDAQHLCGVAASDAPPFAPRLVLGPGTGLGMACVTRVGERWHVLPGEGGHATLAPHLAQDMDLIRLLWQRYPHVSAERVLCGPGLALLYRSLAQIAGVAVDPALDAPAIATIAGEQRDTLALETIRTFCRLLGGVAGNAVLTMGATGGVYLAGGVLQKLATLFDADAFRAGFTAKGRFSDYVARVPVLRITHPQPALLGAAALLRE